MSLNVLFSNVWGIVLKEWKGTGARTVGVLVLGLSVSYIPLSRIGYSLLTVLISGQLIGWVQRVRIPRRAKE